MLDAQLMKAVVAAALAEDAPTGDITSTLVIPANAQATAVLAAREPGVFAGADVFAAAFTLTDASVNVELLKNDGDAFASGDELARVSGPARAILTGERVALNFAQRMSGIATLTRQYVDAITGTDAVILDTRKTTPTLRAFERHAVVCGGGTNHRFSLSDAFMAKDNHLAVLTEGGLDVTTALLQVKSQLPVGMVFEVEVDRIDQIEPVLAGGVDVIMLDNFSLADLRTGVALVAGRAKIEASGGVNLTTVAGIAATGVDFVSVGALTHSARALDLGLDVRIS